MYFGIRTKALSQVNEWCKEVTRTIHGIRRRARLIQINAWFLLWITASGYIEFSCLMRENTFNKNDLILETKKTKLRKLSFLSVLEPLILWTIYKQDSRPLYGNISWIIKLSRTLFLKLLHRTTGDRPVYY